MPDTVRYLSAENLTTDDFGDDFTQQEGEIVYDAATVMGPWATMTEASFKKYGTKRLGLGHGQKYRRNEVGHLIKIEG